MRKLVCLTVLGLVVVTLSACGGGGSSAPTGFTDAMLNAGPYYTSVPGDPDGTIQTTIIFTGHGPYVATVTEDRYDAAETLISTDSFTADVTLNLDGTLTAIELTGTSTLTLTGSTASYLDVNFDDGTTTWTDRWYKTQPAGWIGSGIGFTAAMLNAGPTYYTSYFDGDFNLTVQETIAVSGSGPYTVTVTDSYFDASNTFVGSDRIPIDISLEPDGTLLATFANDPANISTITLKAVAADYLDVSGVDSDTTTWNDRWFFSQPAGWLPASYAISFQMLRHQVGPTQNSYRAYIALNKSGVDITATDVLSFEVANSSGLVTPDSSSFFTASYISGDCTNIPCTWAPFSESGLFVNFATLPPDYYAFGLTMFDNSQLLTIIPFLDDIVIPFIDAATMTAVWQGSDLTLSWTNPTGDPEWNNVTHLKIAINSSATGTGTELAYVTVPPTASSVVIPAALLGDITNGTPAGWQVQTRTYTGNPANSQISRGYSAFKALP